MKHSAAMLEIRPFEFGTKARGWSDWCVLPRGGVCVGGGGGVGGRCTIAKVQNLLVLR
jgi:hypothetical protein